jgi:hypothetical protein
MGDFSMNFRKLLFAAGIFAQWMIMPLCKQCSRLNFSGYRKGKMLRMADPPDSFGFDYWVEGFENESDTEDDREHFYGEGAKVQ